MTQSSEQQTPEQRIKAVMAGALRFASARSLVFSERLSSPFPRVSLSSAGTAILRV
ncbi:hypothetical protein RB151_038720 [Providencia rettgeri]|nr:hypothetical protein RB151_038720 [Providencia rettgeri]